MRKSFAQVLKEGRIDIKREYERLYSLMFSKGADQTSIYRISAQVLIIVGLKVQQYLSKISMKSTDLIL